VYGLVFRHVILRMDPERAHQFAVSMYRRCWHIVRAARALRIIPRSPSRAAVTTMGVTFPAPLGLAAGMDKNAVAVRGFAATGFSHVEIGTVTARAQPGNEKPRSWRELDLKGLRNRMGFNNEGADAVARRLARLRSRRSGRAVVVGVNIGKTKVTDAQDAPLDYAYSARTLAPYADYLVVNVSSPNTPGLRDLQSVESLRPILEHVRAAADEASPRRHVPLLVKIAPDLADADVDAVAALALELGLDGVVAVNTTIAHDRGPGGLSGPVLLPRALDVVSRLRERLGEEPCIIGVGGISTAADARALLDAGATLVQGYTGFVYGGPMWAARINRDLAR
jgi:dihydroorotate dehydrogenase